MDSDSPISPTRNHLSIHPNFKAPQNINRTKVYRHYPLVVNALGYCYTRSWFGILRARWSPRMEDLKRRIDALCRKVIELPDNSEELMAATRELRAALGEHTSRLREQVTDLRQKSFPSSSDQRER